jgi:PEP-CTERM motif
VKGTTIILVLLALLAGTGPVMAGPVVSLDLDPVAGGIQSTLSVLPGTQFTVDVVITGVDPGNPLNGFTFDLVYLPAILTADGVMDGGFLLPAVNISEMDLTAPDVNFTETTLGAMGASGSGILAHVLFTAMAPGFSQLSMNDVAITNPAGQSIALSGIANGGVTVTPEPGTVLLFAMGLLGLVFTARRNHA